MSYYSVGAAPKAQRLSPADVLKAVNGVGAKALSPLAPIVKGLPGVPTSIKTKIVNRPIDAIVDILDPIEDALVRVTKRINKSTGKMKRKIFFSEVDMRQVEEWPVDVRSKLDVSTKNLLRRLLSLNHFIALFWDEPLLLAAEMYSEGFDIADGMTKTVAKKFGLSEAQAKGVVGLMRSSNPVKPEQVIQLAKAGTAAWGAAERAANEAQRAAQKAAQSAAGAVANFFGLGAAPLVAGGAGAVSATTVTEVAGAGGVSIPPGIAGTIAWVLSVTLDATAAGAIKAITGAAPAVAPPPTTVPGNSGASTTATARAEAEADGNKIMFVVLGVGAVVAAIVLLKK